MRQKYGGGGGITAEEEKKAHTKVTGEAKEEEGQWRQRRTRRQKGNGDRRAKESVEV